MTRPIWWTDHASVGKKKTASPTPHPTRNDVDLARIKDRKSARIADYVYGIVRESVRAIVWVALCYFAFRTISAFAGTSTTLVSVIDWAVKASFDRWVAWAIATLASGGYYHQRKLRLKVIKELGSYPGELEKIIDARRSSSSLTPSGEPRKEDRDAP